MKTSLTVSIGASAMGKTSRDTAMRTALVTGFLTSLWAGLWVGLWAISLISDTAHAAVKKPASISSQENQDRAKGSSPLKLDYACLGLEAGFAVKAPQGFRKSKADAERLGLCMVYVENKTDFHSSQSILYPRLILARGESAAEEADRLASEAARSMSTPQNKVNVRRRPSLRNARGLEFEVREFRAKSGSQQAELVAYHYAKPYTLIYVMSSKSADALSESTFREALQHVAKLNPKQMTVLRQKYAFAKPAF